MLYVVIVLYPEYATDAWPYKIFVAWVHGDNPTQAARAACEAAADANDHEYPADDFYPLATIRANLPGPRPDH